MQPEVMRDCKYHLTMPLLPLFPLQTVLLERLRGIEGPIIAYRLGLEANTLNLNGQGNSADVWPV